VKIRILSPWRQDGLFREKEGEYLKRLTGIAKVEIEELKGEKGEERDALKREGEKLLSRVGKGSYLVIMTEKGKTFDSIAFSKWLESMALQGRPDITFALGSSAGFDDEVLNNGDMLMSLSPMTFPHQLARVILIEQIYRAFSLIKGNPYHK